MGIWNFSSLGIRNRKRSAVVDTHTHTNTQLGFVLRETTDYKRKRKVHLKHQRGGRHTPNKTNRVHLREIKIEKEREREIKSENSDGFQKGLWEFNPTYQTRHIFYLD